MPKGPRNPKIPRSPGTKSLLADADEGAGRIPVVVAGVEAQAALAAALADEEGALRTADERDVRLVAASDVAVSSRGQQRLRGVGEPHPHVAEAGLDVRPVDVPVRALQLLTADDPVADVHDASGRRRVAIVVDLLLDVALVGGVALELRDDAGLTLELEGEGASGLHHELGRQRCDPVSVVVKGEALRLAQAIEELEELRTVQDGPPVISLPCLG